MAFDTKVLIMDDDLPFVHRLREALTKHGIRDLDWLTNEAEAERYIAELFPVQLRRMPGLLFVDLKMAGTGGFLSEMIAWLQRHPTYRQISVIVFSGSADPADERKSDELGAKAFYKKPAEAGTLDEIIGNILVEYHFGNNP